MSGVHNSQNNNSTITRNSQESRADINASASVSASAPPSEPTNVSTLPRMEYQPIYPSIPQQGPPTIVYSTSNYPPQLYASSGAPIVQASYPGGQTNPIMAGQPIYPVQVIQVQPVGINNYTRTYQEDMTRDQNGLKKGEWESGICSCFDNCVPNCLMSCFCPCISLAQTISRLNLYSYRKSLLYFGLLYILYYIFSTLTRMYSNRYNMNEMDHSTRDVKGSIFGIIDLIIGIILLISIWIIRAKVRKIFQIPGNGCEDCCCSCWCSCCVIAQMATHTKSYKPNDCSCSAPDTLPGYNQREIDRS